MEAFTGSQAPSSPSQTSWSPPRPRGQVRVYGTSPLLRPGRSPPPVGRLPAPSASYCSLSASQAVKQSRTLCPERGPSRPPYRWPMTSCSAPPGLRPAWPVPLCARVSWARPCSHPVWLRKLSCRRRPDSGKATGAR